MMDGMGFGCGGSSLGLKDIKDQTYVFMLNFDFILKQTASKKGLKRRTSQQTFGPFCFDRVIRSFQNSTCRSSANSFRGNYFYLNLALCTVTFGNSA